MKREVAGCPLRKSHTFFCFCFYSFQIEYVVVKIKLSESNSLLSDVNGLFMRTANAFNLNKLARGLIVSSTLIWVSYYLEFLFDKVSL